MVGKRHLLSNRANIEATINDTIEHFLYEESFREEQKVCLNLACRGEGDMGVYGIAVLSFFSSGISVIWILMCGIAVSSSPAVCGFSSFWLTVYIR